MRVLIVSFFIVITASLAVAQDDLQTVLKAGDEYYAMFDNAKALEEYKNAHLAVPGNFEATLKTIRAYIDTGEDIDSKESEEFYLKAASNAQMMIENFPDRAESYYYLALANGKIAELRGGKEKVKLSRSIEVNASKAVKIDPSLFRPHLLLGIYYREIANLNWFLKAFAKTFFGGLPDGTNEDSLRELLKSAELNDKFPRIFYELGLTYDTMGKKDEAVKNLRITLMLPKADHLDDRYKKKARELLKKMGG